MKFINLFIDELGSANPKATNSKVYILSGIMVTSQAREEMKIKSDQIKFKYWNRTDVVFHSREIGRKEGDFSLLKDEKVQKSFIKDIFNLLDNSNFQLFGVVVDKAKIPKNWNEKLLYKKTAEILIRNFILALLAQQKCRGRLIVESATAEKDIYYHKAAGFFLSNGFRNLKIDYKEVQNVLTEISFVTKKNYDIEEQIADLLAYGLRKKHEKTKVNLLSDYEKRLLKVVDQKLFKMHPNTTGKKKKLYSEIESYKIVP